MHHPALRDPNQTSPRQTGACWVQLTCSWWILQQWLRGIPSVCEVTFCCFLTISVAVNANILKTLRSAEERSGHREHQEKSLCEVQSGCSRTSRCLSYCVLHCRKFLFCRVTRRLSSPTPCQQWYLFASSMSLQMVSNNILYGVLFCLNKTLMFNYSFQQTAAL